MDPNPLLEGFFRPFLIKDVARSAQIATGVTPDTRVTTIAEVSVGEQAQNIFAKLDIASNTTVSSNRVNGGNVQDQRHLPIRSSPTSLEHSLASQWTQISAVEQDRIYLALQEKVHPRDVLIANSYHFANPDQTSEELYAELYEHVLCDVCDCESCYFRKYSFVMLQQLTEALPMNLVQRLRKCFSIPYLASKPRQ